MGSLIVPSSVARTRRAQLEQQQPRKGLGKALHTVDPAEQIFKNIGMTKPGKLPGWFLHGNRVLVAVYERPGQLDSGVWIPDQTRAEDQHQGKSALVLMKGHSAFVSDKDFDFGPDNVEPGDWVSLAVSDGRKIVIKGVLCRLIRDQDIIMRIPAPDDVY